jgi:hypothetical protein
MDSTARVAYFRSCRQEVEIEQQLCCLHLGHLALNKTLNHPCTEPMYGTNL